MAKKSTIASIITFIILLALGAKAVNKGIHFGETWRVIAAIICLAILTALLIESMGHRDKPNH